MMPPPSKIDGKSRPIRAGDASKRMDFESSGDLLSPGIEMQVVLQSRLANRCSQPPAFKTKNSPSPAINLIGRHQKWHIKSHASRWKTRHGELPTQKNLASSKETCRVREITKEFQNRFSSSPFCRHRTLHSPIAAASNAILLTSTHDN